MAVSKRLRYEVLRRDSHTCRYCGARAPGVQLRVDHVIPKALGGSDDPSNLVTACEPCNTGKTSSAPDAPLAADVAGDALRWSRALAAAADQMRSKIAEDAGRHRQFDEWWSAWTCGADRRPVPRDPGWRKSVDAFIAAGLPPEVLEWCVQTAMTSKAPPDKTWRYMCGIAWRKVRELQESARSLTAVRDVWDTTGWEEDLPPEVIRGRADLACELLGDLSGEDRDGLLAWVREKRDPADEYDLHIQAAHQAWRSQRTVHSWLLHGVCDLLPVIPDPVVQSAVREARTDLYDKHGADFTREEWACHAMDLAAARYAGTGESEDAATSPEPVSDDPRASGGSDHADPF